MSLFGREKNQGFTIVELVVVLAIFVLVIASFFGASRIAFRAVTKASDKEQATFLLEEGSEGVRYLRDMSWDRYIDKEQLGYEECLYFDSANNMFATSTPEIVSQWHLDEVAGPSVFDDSNFQNTGTQVNGVAFGSPGVNVNGITNYATAASFNGSSYIATNIAPDDSVNPSLKLDTAMLGSGITIEAWAYPTIHPAVPNQDKVIVMSTAGLAFGWAAQGGFKTYCDLSNCFVTFSLPFAPNPSLLSISVNINKFPLNSWSHLVGTYDAVSHKMTFYINGIEVANTLVDTSTRTPDWRAPFQIGARDNDNSGGHAGFFVGKIDEVVIYNRALSPAEVLDRYNGHAICKVPTIHNDNTDVFTRTVTFWNVCRNASSDIVGQTTNTLVGGACTGGTVDTSTKWITIRVIWGSAHEFVQKVDMYLSDLFLR